MHVPRALWLAIPLPLIALICWQVARQHDVEAVTNLTILKTGLVEVDPYREDWNAWGESRHYELQQTPHQAFLDVIHELREKGWEEGPVVPAKRMVGGSRKIVGYNHNIELHKGNVDLYFGVGPSIRRKDPRKADAFLTIFHHRVRPFWERALREAHLG